MKSAWHVFFAVFIVGFMIQIFLRNTYAYLDSWMWADQLKYYLNNNAKMFDFYAAYGHPGGSLLVIGSVYRKIFNFSYYNSMIMALSTIVSLTSAFCSVICYKLRSNNSWWLTTAIILILNRLSLYSTPPTEAVMPLIVLMTLLVWLFLEDYSYRNTVAYFLFGIVVGVSAATRLDVTVLIAVPFVILVCAMCGLKMVPYALFGMLLGFYVADPFLWFMPYQHACDLVNKFIIHHKNFNNPQSMSLSNFWHASVIAIISILFYLFSTGFGKFTKNLPKVIIFTYIGITLVSSVIIFSSSFQTPRYFYPVFIFWEILLPYLVLEYYESRFLLNGKTARSLNISVVMSVFLITFLSSRPGFSVISYGLNILFGLDIIFAFSFDC